MSQLLLITSSIHRQDATSSQLAHRYVDRYVQQHAVSQVLSRDLDSDPVPHLDAGSHAAFVADDPATLSSSQQQALALSDSLITELKESDVIVLAAPMYNFSIPSTLKSWIDNVARAGETFHYTSQGPKGLLENKQVVVITTRGGQYAGSPTDTHTAYLQQVLGFMGLTHVEFIYVEGQAQSDIAQQQRQQAEQSIYQLAAA